MITAVDTNVLLDIFGGDAEFGSSSADAVRTCMSEGSMLACEVVWAETAASFKSSSDAAAALARLRVEFCPLDASTSLAAGESWRAYRDRRGGRERVIADFLIGAHALAYADRLLTRDREFYRSYFRDLTILDPAIAPLDRT